MKKNRIIFSTALIVFSLVVYGVLNVDTKVTDQTEISEDNRLASITGVSKNMKKNSPRFFYSVGTRYDAIKKSDLIKAKSITDFLSKQQMPPLESYQSVSIIVVKDNKQTNFVALSKDDKLSKSQIELLKAADFSTNILVRGDYEQINEETLQTKYDYWCPHFTIVPNQQAEYIDGEDALITYLEERGHSLLGHIDQEKLNSAKVYFTVTQQGKITNTRIESNSSDPDIDKKIIEVINTTSGAWKPAKNVNGEYVDQELVFSFSIGC
ncbi:energy transducer TonB [Psychroserpens luteolus]|uniref:energy transducer TonB n=1 Tax=Psychroserpens luteolus TaxID=2855840 RepID=UPI001E323FDA|nr:energy transducer TonB [Psychroserpens luteolus]MCD2259298.1 energy transducer TonB [Psychroserpens luteolus]